MTAALHLLRVPTTPVIPVATIERSTGAIYLLGEQSLLEPTGELSVLAAGQAVVTGPDSGAALTLHRGGQLRVGAGTRIEFIADDTLRLESGRIYFDSRAPLLSPQTDSDEVATFLIQTDQGTVRHSGTQFMVERSERTLAVTVREGRVEIDGDFHDATAEAGQRVTLEGRNRPVTGRSASYGDAWSWVEATAPAPRIDNPTIHQFLVWVARETGLRVHFATPEAEDAARHGNLVGHIDSPPTEALRIWMSTVDLDWRIEDGVIVVSEP